MKILFQGDSVTDAGRDRNNIHDLGGGYPKFAAAMLQDAYPSVDFEFVDLGIGGNRTENLVERLENDFIAIQPDIVSIMIGINDVWHHYSHNILTTDSDFEKNYRVVLDALKARTNAKILIIQPFLLETVDPGKMKHNICFSAIFIKIFCHGITVTFINFSDFDIRSGFIFSVTDVSQSSA